MLKDGFIRHHIIKEQPSKFENFPFYHLTLYKREYCLIERFVYVSVDTQMGVLLSIFHVLMPWMHNVQDIGQKFPGDWQQVQSWNVIYLLKTLQKHTDQVSLILDHEKTLVHYSVKNS